MSTRCCPSVCGQSQRFLTPSLTGYNGTSATWASATSSTTSTISWSWGRPRHPSAPTHSRYSFVRAPAWAYLLPSTSARARRRVLPSWALRWTRSPANSDSQPANSIASNPSSRSGATGRRASGTTSNLSSES